MIWTQMTQIFDHIPDRVLAAILVTKQYSPSEYGVDRNNRLCTLTGIVLSVTE